MTLMVLPLCRAQEPSLPVAAESRPHYPPFPSWQARERELLKTVFGRPALAESLPGAAIDQLRGFPTDWGHGASGYGVRAASRYGRFLLDQTIAAQVQILHKEDTRYLRLGTGDFLSRTRYALVHSFVARTPGGGRTFAVSVPAGAYGSWAIASRWHPEGFRDPLTVFRYGSSDLGGKVFGNILREFWPDIKFRIFRKKHSPPAAPPAPPSTP